MALTSVASSLRGRGRVAPKAPAEEPEDSNVIEGEATPVAEAPKRRGRPPKNAEAQAPAEAPKRRGRPPKTADGSTEAPKRRGRAPAVESTTGTMSKRELNTALKDILAAAGEIKAARDEALKKVVDEFQPQLAELETEHHKLSKLLF